MLGIYAGSLYLFVGSLHCWFSLQLLALSSALDQLFIIIFIYILI